MLKIRLGLYSFLAVLLVAGAGVAAMRGTWEGPGTKTSVAGGDELVTLFIKFTPTPREQHVTISWSAGAKTGSSTQKGSPWVHEVMVPPGSVVRLNALQIEDGFLECRVRKGFKKLAEQDNMKTQGRQVFCEATT